MQKTITIYILLLLGVSSFSLSGSFIFRQTPCLYLSLAGSFLLAIVAIVGMFKKQFFSLTSSEIVLILLLLVVALHAVYIERITPLWFLSFVSLLVLYMLVRRVNLQQDWLIGGIIMMGLVQAMYGIGQYFRWFPNVASNYPVSGSFDNPAGFAASLVILFPVALVLVSRASIYMRIVGVTAALILFVSIVLSESRAGFLALLFVLAYWLYHTIKIKFLARLSKCIKISITSVLIVAILVGLYFIKKDSADGRLLIWQITAQMIADKPLSGHGVGGFKKDYMLYQASFLKEHPDNKSTPLADIVRHPFNELLLLMVEHGVPGILFVSLFVFLVVKTHRQTKNDTSIYAVYSLIGLMFFAMFSYPLNFPFIRLTMVLSFAIIMQNEKRLIILPNRLTPAIKLSSLLVCVILLGASAKLFYDDYQWNIIAKRSLRGETLQVLPDYARLYKTMNQNDLFLYNYGAELNYIGEWEQSNIVLSECALIYNDNDLQLLFADNYQRLHQYRQAEECLLLAYQMIPNRFIPLYRLVKLYELQGKDKQALMLARSILEKPIKINSVEILSIRTEMEQLIEKINFKAVSTKG